MTLARRKLLFGIAALVAAARSRPARATLTERIFVDPVSGIAILGYDCVAFFIKGKATAGRTEHEVEWANAVWRFESAGNAAAFRRDPEVYAPAFGGYDAESILRGTVVGSDPGVFAIIDQRLVLFRHTDGRDRFVAEGSAALAAAQAQWKTLEPQLGA